MANFKPMLAGKADPATLRFPVLASPKLDGVRCMAMAGQPMSRSMKLIPNLHIQKLFTEHSDVLDGLDGEFIVGEPTDPDVYRNTVSFVMSDNKVEPFKFFVFDYWNKGAMTSNVRNAMLFERTSHIMCPDFVQLVNQVMIHNNTGLDTYETECLIAGYEGIMTRDPFGTYKQGRASSKSQELLKVKRYEDTEARIIGFEEKMHNGNEAKTNELGRTARSSHQANLTGLDTLGALVCEGLPNTPFAGIQFNIGTGFDDAERASIWAKRPQLKGTLVKFKYFPVGMKDAPRHPVYLGSRSITDR